MADIHSMLESCKGAPASLRLAELVVPNLCEERCGEAAHGGAANVHGVWPSPHQTLTKVRNATSAKGVHQGPDGPHPLATLN